jgi:hypothetical protein
MVACISIRFYLLIAFLLFLSLRSLGMWFGCFYYRVDQNETHSRRRFTKQIYLPCVVSFFYFRVRNSIIAILITLYWRADLSAKSIDHLFWERNKAGATSVRNDWAR